MATTNILTGRKTVKETAGADIFNIASDATKVTIAGKMKAGDIINIEGLAAEYTVKASGRTITLKSDTQTITFQLDGAAGSASVRFYDGDLTATYSGKTAMLGSQKLGKKFVDVNDAVMGANDSSAAIDGATGGSSSGGSSGTTGSTFTLTANPDVFSPNMANEVSRSTAGNDTFRAVASGDLASADVIDGGAGTDLLKANVTANDQTIAPVLTSVENVEIALTSVDAKDLTLDFTDAADVTSVKITAADTAADDTEVIIKGVATTDAVNLATSYAGGNTLTKATVTYDSVTGTADSATLAVGGNITDVVVAGIETLTVNATTFSGKITAAAATTVTINAGSDAKKTTTISDVAQGTAALATLNLGGSGETLDVTTTAIDFKASAVVNITNTGATKVKIADVAAAADTLTVTAAGGKDTVDITAFSTGEKATVNTGGGNDTIKIAAGVVAVDAGDGDDTVELTAAGLTKADAVKGGSGTDTVAAVIADLATIAGDSDKLSALSGFEKVKSTDALAGTGFDMSKFGSNYLVLGDDVANATTVTGVTSGATVEATKNADFTAALSITMTGATNAGANSDVLNVIGNADLGNQANAAAATEIKVGVAAIETINFVGNDADNADEATAGDDGYILTLSNDSSVRTIKASGSSEFSYTATGTVDNLETVDASALTGEAIIDVDLYDGANGIVIKGSTTAKNTIKGSDRADIISGGSKVDNITGGTGADTITLGGGIDVVNVAAGDAGTTGGEKITDFAIGTSGDNLNLATTTKIADASTAVNVASAITGGVGTDTLTATVKDGIITLAGNATAKIDTVAELILIFQALDADNSAEVGAIVMGGNTYVITDAAAGAGNADSVNDVIQLVGVTSATAIVTTAAAGGILVS